MPRNAAWHAKHPMPARATLAQRVKWHIAHARECGCREMPASIRAEIRRVAEIERGKGEPKGES